LIEFGLNLVVHQHDAWVDTLQIMESYAEKLRGVFHCFGGTLDAATAASLFPCSPDTLVTRLPWLREMGGKGVRATQQVNESRPASKPSLRVLHRPAELLLKIMIDMRFFFPLESGTSPIAELNPKHP